MEHRIGFAWSCCARSVAKILEYEQRAADGSDPTRPLSQSHKTVSARQGLLT